MSGRDPTQKQIAEKYKGNLAYFRRGHYLRRIRGWTFFLTVIVSIAAVLGFRYWGNDEFLSTGPISENHARFANNCQACHEGAETDLLKVLPFEKLNAAFHGAKDLSVDKVTSAAGGLSLPSLDSVKASAGKISSAFSSEVNQKNIQALAEKGLSLTSLSHMDRACLNCHEPMALHQPQTAVISLKGVLKDLPLVHTGACSSCHREHVGHERMKLPDSRTCESCHNDTDQLARTSKLLKSVNSHPLTVAENRNLGDGLIRFLTPPNPEPAKPFKTYADGHPPFSYEQALVRDPAHIKYNHARHDQGDIPQLNGHQLTCTDCHETGSGGVRYQPVKYEKHCQSCHSLHLDPDLPEVKIPHGDTEKVRDFLRPDSLTLHFAEAFRIRGITDRLELGKRIKGEFDNLASRGMTTGEELERRVFYVGDPPMEMERNSPKSNKTPFFASCAKCHDLQNAGAGAPKVTPTNIAERWVQRGPFTHVPHAHMDCLDCHAAAKTSKLTSDILMPTQKSCAECHRPLDMAKLGIARDTLKLRAELKPGSRELADTQRQAGGVKSDCQSCHVFHAPASATLLLHNAHK